MQVVSGSLLCQFFLRLWIAALNAYESSALARLFRAVAHCWKQWWHNSILVRWLMEKDGVLFRAWPDSLLCGLLTALLNLPVTLLHWIYQKLQPVFEDSLAAQLIFSMGDNTSVAIGWLMLVIMNIPYAHWNNGYSLAGYTLLFLLAMAGGMRRRTLRMDVIALGPYVICFLFAVCLSWPLSMYPNSSFRFLYYHAACALCVLLVVSTIEYAEQLERLAGFLCLGMIGAASYGIFQRIQGIEVNRSYVDVSLNANMPGRIYSFYENPNSFAEMLVLLIPVAVALLFGARSRLWKLVGLIGTGIGGTALIMTYSRASWLGLVAAALVFLFLWNRKLLPICIALGLCCIPLLPSTILNRILTIFNPNDTSTSSRIPLYRAALRMAKHTPITGAGLGTEAVKNGISALGFYNGVAPYTHAHNIYLQIWLETGALGILSFVAAMFHTLKRGAKAIFHSDCSKSVQLIIIGTLSGICGNLVCGMADYLWTYPRVMLIFWCTVALLLAGVRLSGREVNH